MIFTDTFTPGAWIWQEIYWLTGQIAIHRLEIIGESNGWNQTEWNRYHTKREIGRANFERALTFRVVTLNTEIEFLLLIHSISRIENFDQM